MSEQKGYWGTFELLEEKKNEEYNLLSNLISKKDLKDSDSSLFSFIKRAIIYFASKSESFRTYFNANLDKLTDYTKLIEYVDKYPASTTEEIILRHEMLNLLFAIPNTACVCNKKYNTDMPKSLKNEIAVLKVEFEKASQGEVLASKANLLSQCVKYRPWGGKGGRVPVEEFTTQVFCHFFNFSEVFKASIAQDINNQIRVFNKQVMLRVIMDNGDWFKGIRAIPEEPDKDNRWDIVIKIDDSTSVMVENKIASPIGKKETGKYLESPFISSYFWLTCMSQEKFRDLKEDLVKRGVAGANKINHISWTDGEDSILSTLNGCSHVAYDYEPIYLEYFINLIKSVTASVKGMSFDEFLKLMEPEALKVFQKITNTLKWSVNNASLCKDGCIYAFPTDKNNEEWFCPFRIKLNGVFDIQWKAGIFQKDKTLKKKFIEELKKSDTIRDLMKGEKCSSFNIKSLLDSDIQTIRNAVSWLKEGILR